MILFASVFLHPVVAQLGHGVVFAIALLATIGVLVLAFYITKRLEKKRSQAIKTFMTPFGFNFTEDASADYHIILGRFKLGQKGRHKRLKNLLVLENADGSSIRVFDCHYVVDSGKNSRSIMQTVFLAESSKMDLPSFRLSPENVFHRIGQKFGQQDFDFADYPKFSEMFLLKGDNETAIREAFTPAVLSSLEQYPKIFLEGNAQQLLFYRDSVRQKPEKFDEFIKTGSELTTVFMRGR